MHQSFNKTFIKEIFTSIQGEGLYVGEKQIFVRFCKCNLNCNYCDTDFKIKNAKEYSTFELFEILKKNPVQTVSFTGGEPLLEVEFLKELFSNFDLDKKIYLETNGICYDELSQIIDFVDVVSMDIKLNSATKQKNRFSDNEKFLKIANQKEAFIKVVFDENITVDEIDEVVKLAKINENIIVLQPKMPMNKDFCFEKIFDEFYLKYKNIRLIPQVHKFLGVE
jgi:organic radical activating enzyme